VAGWLIIDRWVRVMVRITYHLLLIWAWSLRNYLGARTRVGWLKIEFSKLLMQLPKIMVVAITMVDLQIRVIPLS
jgi:hypothetical protein